MVALSFNSDQLLAAGALGFVLGLGWHLAAWLVAAVTSRLAGKRGPIA